MAAMGRRADLRAAGLLALLTVLMALLSGCASAEGLDAPSGRVSALLVCTMVDLYPDDVRLWAEAVEARWPDADVDALSGDVDGDDVLSWISSVEADELVLVYHGHGGRGYAWLGEEEHLAWADLMAALSSKALPFTAIIDACHSGTAVEPFTSSTLTEDAVLVASCGPEELAWGTVRPGNGEGSASWLLRSLLLFSTIPSRLDGPTKSQHPQVWRYDADEDLMETRTLPQPTAMAIDRRWSALV